MWQLPLHNLMTLGHVQPEYHAAYCLPSMPAFHPARAQAALQVQQNTSAQS